MKKKNFLTFLIIFFLSLNNSFSIEPDIFVQSTVNRASEILSEGTSKEEKIKKLKSIEMKLSLKARTYTLEHLENLNDEENKIIMNYLEIIFN